VICKFLHLHFVMRVSMSMRDVSSWKGTWNLGSSLKGKRRFDLHSMCMKIALNLNHYKTRAAVTCSPPATEQFCTNYHFPVTVGWLCWLWCSLNESLVTFCPYDTCFYKTDGHTFRWNWQTCSDCWSILKSSLQLLLVSHEFHGSQRFQNGACDMEILYGKN